MTPGRRKPAGLFSIAGSREGDRVTTLELFFDLVFVFAFTQVTGIVTHGDVPLSFVDAFVVLSLLWFSWCAFSWLANEARADVGCSGGRSSPRRWPCSSRASRCRTRSA